MAQKPIFCVTHPRACSTAFERVFMTRKDLVCLHEPFGDAFYYGPERMSTRFEDDEEAREASGFADSTYKTIFDRIERESDEGKRIFIKDIIYYLLPPDGRPPQIPPSLTTKKRGIGTETNGHANGYANGNSSDQRTLPFPYNTYSEPGNPTVIPGRLLQQFHYTFLIRDPHYSIPSFYRCTVPPLNKVTGFHEFYPSEAGYEEVRRVFDYLVSTQVVGPELAGHEQNGTTSNGVGKGHVTSPGIEVCVVDADDLLDNPAQMVQAYCKTVGLEWDPDMLQWKDKSHQDHAVAAFKKWEGWHNDALDSTELRPREHKKVRKTEAQFDQEWAQKYGLKGATLIRKVVDENMATYNYLKQFAIRVEQPRPFSAEHYEAE